MARGTAAARPAPAKTKKSRKAQSSVPEAPKRPLGERFVRNLKKYWQYYILLLPALAYFLIFCYGPMYGAQIAFRNFNAKDGITGSPWVGFDHFIRFFRSPYFGTLLRNTFVISLYGLVAGFPLPIILALSLNELQNQKVKKFAQTVTYAPYFISMVVMCGMLISFLSPSTGIINKAIVALGGEPIPFLSEASLFPSIYVWSGVWQGTGWGSVIYFAALSGVDPQLLEAATLDGATRLQKIWYINIPTLLPTIVIMLIMNCGNLLSVGYEKAFLLQNALNLDTSEVISTYVYKTGLVNAQYSFSTAIGLFNSVVNLILLVTVNMISRKISDNSLW